MADREKVKEAYLNDKHHLYHKDQYKKPKRSTVALGDFVRKTLPSKNSPYSAIDVGCGGGANIYYLSQILSNTEWSGLDFSDKYFSLAKQYFLEDGSY